jgi:hypothetical protein
MKDSVNNKSKCPLFVASDLSGFFAYYCYATCAIWALGGLPSGRYQPKV